MSLCLHFWVNKAWLFKYGSKLIISWECTKIKYVTSTARSLVVYRLMAPVAGSWLPERFATERVSLRHAFLLQRKLNNNLSSIYVLLSTFKVLGSTMYYLYLSLLIDTSDRHLIKNTSSNRNILVLIKAILESVVFVRLREQISAGGLRD